MRSMPARRTFRRPFRASLDASSLPASLSARELEVLALIVKGHGNKQIAYALGIAEHTVKNHVKSILSKLDVEDRDTGGHRGHPAGVLFTLISIFLQN